MIDNDNLIVTVKLDFMQRDTLLACLKDMKMIKENARNTAETETEKYLNKRQAEIVQELYDEIYAQKIKEFEESGGVF